MKCPKCESTNLKVNEKRDLEVGSAIRRRRECNSCGFRFTTYERIEAPSISVVKKSGEKEAYRREKLSAGLYKAFEKRPIEAGMVEEIIEEVEREIVKSGKREVETEKIGNILIKKIKQIDDVAYIRFASVYKSFEDAQTFKKELESIIKE